MAHLPAYLRQGHNILEGSNLSEVQLRFESFTTKTVASGCGHYRYRYCTIKMAPVLAHIVVHCVGLLNAVWKCIPVINNSLATNDHYR